LVVDAHVHADDIRVRAEGKFLGDKDPLGRGPGKGQAAGMGANLQGAGSKIGLKGGPGQAGDAAIGKGGRKRGHAFGKDDELLFRGVRIDFFPVFFQDKPDECRAPG